MKTLEIQASNTWVAIARSGNPNHRALPEWPAHTAAKKAVMLFDTPCKVENEPGGKLRAMLAPGATVRPTTPGPAPTSGTR